MTDPLSILREYTINKKPIIEEDGKIIFGTYSWPKTVKTNYARLIWEAEKNKTHPEYYTLETLVFLMQHVDLPHPAYCRKAKAENVPCIKRPDRKGLLNYLRGITSKSKSINEQLPTVFPTEVKTESNERRNEVYVEECFSIERSSLSSESSRNSLSENDAEIKTEPDNDTNMEENSSNMGSTSLPDRNTWSEKNIQIKTEPGEDTNEVDMEAHSSIMVSSTSDNSRNFLSRKNPNKLIPKKKSQSRVEIFERKRDYERKHATNKNEPKRLDAFKEKDRQKYLKEKEAGIRKSNSELANRKKRKRRNS